MSKYLFQIQLNNSQGVAYTDTLNRARAILEDYFLDGQINYGQFEVEQVCICNGHYRRTTAPGDMTGHFNNTGFYCCPHVGNTCGKEHDPIVYGNYHGPNRSYS